jgi:hypothetical protein
MSTLRSRDSKCLNLILVLVLLGCFSSTILMPKTTSNQPRPIVVTAVSVSDIDQIRAFLLRHDTAHGTERVGLPHQPLPSGALQPKLAGFEGLRPGSSSSDSTSPEKGRCKHGLVHSPIHLKASKEGGDDGRSAKQARRACDGLQDPLPQATGNTRAMKADNVAPKGLMQMAYDNELSHDPDAGAKVRVMLSMGLGITDASQHAKTVSILDNILSYRDQHAFRAQAGNSITKCTTDMLVKHLEDRQGRGDLTEEEKVLLLIIKHRDVLEGMERVKSW